MVCFSLKMTILVPQIAQQVAHWIARLKGYTRHMTDTKDNQYLYLKGTPGCFSESTPNGTLDTQFIQISKGIFMCGFGILICVLPKATYQQGGIY
jgi:hypothetical protein